MDREGFVAIMITTFAVFAIVMGYPLFVSILSPESKAVAISRQNPAVQTFISQDSSVKYGVGRSYVDGDGSVYRVDNNWVLIGYGGGTEKPTDGKGHYCWVVSWFDPTSIIDHVVYVYVDKDSWKIVGVEGVW